MAEAWTRERKSEKKREKELEEKREENLFAESHEEVVRLHVAVDEVLPVDKLDPRYLNIK